MLLIVNQFIKQSQKSRKYLNPEISMVSPFKKEFFVSNKTRLFRVLPKT